MESLEITKLIVLWILLFIASYIIVNKRDVKVGLGFFCINLLFTPFIGVILALFTEGKYDKYSYWEKPDIDSAEHYQILESLPYLHDDEMKKYARKILAKKDKERNLGKSKN